jgi:hypothetical protein
MVTKIKVARMNGNKVESKPETKTVFEYYHLAIKDGVSATVEEVGNDFEVTYNIPISKTTLS